MKQERIGQIFVKAGLISADELHAALSENRTQTQERLGETLVRLGFASEAEIARALSFQLRLPYVDLQTVVVDPAAIQKLPLKLAVEKRLLPVYLEKNTLSLAMEDPLNLDAIEAASFASGLTILPHIAEPSKISTAIQRYYSVEDSLETILQNVTPIDPVEMIVERHISPEKVKKLKEQGESPAIMKLLNTLIIQGISARATSIFLEPGEEEVSIKYTIDGMPVENMRIPKWTQGSLVSRIKMLAGLDIAQRYERQEGRMTFKMLQRLTDLQVFCVPTHYGERVLLKFLETGSSIPAMEELGFSPDSLKQIRNLLHAPSGFILVYGPAGSGKTTLLYSLAHELAQRRMKLVTVESSIEYALKGIQQVRVDKHDGLTYARAANSVLRHHPDALFIGELRDRETVEIAMNAARDTCLVLSGIQQPDIMSVFTFFWELGTDAELAASSLSGVVSLRVIRKVCEQCREPYEPSSELLRTIQARLGETLSLRFLHGKGCKACHYTGYNGRLGVAHVFPISRSLRTFISQGAPDGTMKEALKASDMKRLIKEILALVERGLTTIEELERALFATKNSDTDESVSHHHDKQFQAQNTSATQEDDTRTQVSSAIGTEQIERLDQIPVSQQSDDNGYAFQGKNILLVDDDRDMIQRLKFILQDKQFSVSTAANGEEALESIEREKPHLIVTDIMMPRMDGLELIRRLRKDVRTTFIPVIILSSKNDTADRLKGFAVGTDDYLPKPFSIHELFFRINAILKRVYR